MQKLGRREAWCQDRRSWQSLDQSKIPKHKELRPRQRLKSGKSSSSRKFLVRVWVTTENRYGLELGLLPSTSCIAPWHQRSKEPPAVQESQSNMGSISGSARRSLGRAWQRPLQYSCHMEESQTDVRNCTDGIAQKVNTTESNLAPLVPIP